jgi:predicted extracellular nuclease
VSVSASDAQSRTALGTIAFSVSSGAAPKVVISQVYGGGGNSGATLENDFVELFNADSVPVSLTGWSVQYTSSSGTSWQVTPLSGTIQPGQHYLVQEAQGAGGTADLPTPDASGTIAMSGTSGKVALADVTTALSGSCPSLVVDLVGYGTANCFEGIAAAPTLSNTTAALRRGAGCVDTADNAADFTSGTPTPRNTGAALTDCSAPPAPEVAIHEIQGAGGTSPLVGQSVTTRGIVTARKANGFFLQGPDADMDADPATSAGVLVFTGSTPPAAAAVGAEVLVSGTVQEFVPSADPSSPPTTEIGGPSVTLLSNGNRCPLRSCSRPSTRPVRSTSSSGTRACASRSTR